MNDFKLFFNLGAFYAKSSGEFVIFDKTINNIYHGHVRTWSELTQEMKNVLINNGLVDRKGKIK